MPGELSGKAAIVGIGATDFSKNSGRSELRLASEAVLDALDDAGLTPARCRRHGHVHDGLQHRGRHRARHGYRGAEVLLQDPPRRRRGVRDGPAGGDRGGDRCRGLRCRIPGFQRALRGTVRPGPDATGGKCRLDRRRQLILVSTRPVHAGRAGRDDRPAVHASVGCDEQGLRRDLGGRPQARRQQPEGVLLREADHDRGSPEFAVDRRAAAAAGLLSGDRWRCGTGRDFGGARKGSQAPARDHRGGVAGFQPGPVFDGQLLPARTGPARDGSGRAGSCGHSRGSSRPISRPRSSTTTSPRSR